jgi:hypothetical protein
MKYKGQQKTPPKLSNNSTMKEQHTTLRPRLPPNHTTTTTEAEDLPRESEEHHGSTSSDEDITWGCRRCQHRQRRAELSLGAIQIPNMPPATITSPGLTVVSHTARQSQSVVDGTSTPMPRATPQRPPPWRPKTPRASSLPMVEFPAGSRQTTQPPPRSCTRRARKRP